MHRASKTAKGTCLDQDLDPFCPISVQKEQRGQWARTSSRLCSCVGKKNLLAGQSVCVPVPGLCRGVLAEGIWLIGGGLCGVVVTWCCWEEVIVTAPHTEQHKGLRIARAPTRRLNLT